VFVATTDDGEVAKILDFGIARVSSKDAALTQSGALMGTPAYMAPEQVAGNRGAIGPWTDVYSMGVILHEALTGVSPFGAETVTEVLGKVLGRNYTPLAEQRPDLPRAITDVVERAMADAPEERFPNADALREAWVAATGGKPQTSTEPQGKPRKVDVTAPTQEVPTGPTSGGATGGLSTAPTITPSPVVVDRTIEPAKKGRAGLWIALGVLVAGGATAAIVLAQAKHTTIATTPTTTIDAAPAPPPDASLAPPPPDAAAPAPPPDPDADMARFAGGTVTIGADARTAHDNLDADPPHRVNVAPFLLDKHEVTLAAFRAALHDDAAGGLTGDRPDWPARYVTADQAAAACAAMGKRLPTEAEWDVAAQAARVDPSAARLKGGPDAPDSVGAHAGDCTPDGVCDLLGNVMEWTADAWTRPKPRAGRRVVRGGSFRVDPSDNFYATMNARVAAAPGTPDPELGFRCAKDAK
jgi:serine/threonine-protein kinase